MVPEIVNCSNVMPENESRPPELNGEKIRSKNIEYKRKYRRNAILKKWKKASTILSKIPLLKSYQIGERGL